MSLIIPSASDAERIEQFRRLENAWHDSLVVSDRAKATRDKYIDALRGFVRWCWENDVLLGSVSRGDVCRWRDEMQNRYSVSTIQQRLAAIRSFYDWCLEHDLVASNPADRVRCAGGGRGSLRRDELTDDEMRSLLASCSFPRDDRRVALRDRAILYLMAFCALRTIEVQRASREDLRQRQGRMILWVQRKGHREPDEFVVVPASAEQALREWLAEHPLDAKGPLFVSLSKRNVGNRLTTNYIRRMVKNRLRSCGIDDPAKTTHSLRHSAITRARRGGASLTDIRAMAGHRKLETTLRYLHDKTRIKKPAEDRINYGERADDAD